MERTGWREWETCFMAMKVKTPSGVSIVYGFERADACTETEPEPVVGDGG
jgi:hypothetical protein